MPADLTQVALKAFGRLDGIVLNHGMLDTCKIEASTLEGWKHIYDVNVFSCLAMVGLCNASLGNQLTGSLGQGRYRRAA